VSVRVSQPGAGPSWVSMLRGLTWSRSASSHPLQLRRESAFMISVICCLRVGGRGVRLGG
jgi:hypothetical protein